MMRQNPVNKVDDEDLPDKVPAPSHRHAAPSGPWPWMNLDSAIEAEQLTSEGPPVPEFCDHTTCEGRCWQEYPKSKFPNWTDDQVDRAKIRDAVREYDDTKPCTLHLVDVDDRGRFHSKDPLIVKEDTKEDFWNGWLQEKREEGVRVRSVFVQNMSGPVLQMLGARYNIEPFFFSSSLNWIPSRYQEEVRPKQGDHITITLTFLTTAPRPLKRVKRTDTTISMGGDIYSQTPGPSSASVNSEPFTEGEQVIDTQAPLAVRTADGEHRILLLDLLAVHVIRDSESSTIISYHPVRAQTEEGLPMTVRDRHGRQMQANRPSRQPTPTNTMHGPHAQGESMPSKEMGTSAQFLARRIRLAGQSVYWQSLYANSPDPSFILITYLWHALYAWDEALETLYQYVCWLETRVIKTSEMALTRELHIIRAHHLHYSSLLKDFAKSVRFVLDTPNPVMDADNITEEVKKQSRQWLERECNNLLSEIERLQKGRKMQDQRLKNVMNLVFSSVNINDSKRMQRLTEAAVKDSAAMKQIAYLTMVFLPASFLATVFGMNVHEITDGGRQSVPRYIAGAVTLTIVTIWVIMAFQSAEFHEDPQSATVTQRLLWPYFWARKAFKGLNKKVAFQDPEKSKFGLRRTASPEEDDHDHGISK
ncbi:hypothetical protein ONZ45_g1008 [Pleurotus djamor]|nr:hypothetical protein ONZ45_g1008 [Pleurotus djamor]